MASGKRQHHSNRLRIIGGTWRGRQFSFRSGSQLRPTPDNVRETLFNWLAPHVHQARCLDLYSGSGAIGLEALSRGADQVTFVENDRRHGNMIRDHLETLSADERATVKVMNALQCLATLRDTVPRPEFDLVFMDPPFGQDLVHPTLDALADGQILSSSALIYVEHEKSLDIEPPTHWNVWREKTHGGSTSLLLTPDDRTDIQTSIDA